MSRRIIDCPECGERSTVISQSMSPIQCCPFCGNTILADSSEDDDDDGGLREFDPDEDDVE